MAGTGQTGWSIWECLKYPPQSAVTAVVMVTTQFLTVNQPTGQNIFSCGVSLSTTFDLTVGRFRTTEETYVGVWGWLVVGRVSEGEAPGPARRGWGSVRDVHLLWLALEGSMTNQIMALPIAGGVGGDTTHT